MITWSQIQKIILEKSILPENRFLQKYYIHGLALIMLQFWLKFRRSDFFQWMTAVVLSNNFVVDVKIDLKNPYPD